MFAQVRMFMVKITSQLRFGIFVHVHRRRYPCNKQQTDKRCYFKSKKKASQTCSSFIYHIYHTQNTSLLYLELTGVCHLQYINFHFKIRDKTFVFVTQQTMYILLPSTCVTAHLPSHTFTASRLNQCAKHNIYWQFGRPLFHTSLLQMF